MLITNNGYCLDDNTVPVLGQDEMSVFNVPVCSIHGNFVKSMHGLPLQLL